MYPWYGYHMSSILIVGSMVLKALVLLAVAGFILTPILFGDGDALGDDEEKKEEQDEQPSEDE